jgi:hypothetical protein
MDNFTYICGLNTLFFIFTEGKDGSRVSDADVVVVKTDAYAKMFSSGMHTVSGKMLCRGRPPFKVVLRLQFLNQVRVIYILSMVACSWKISVP